MDDSQRSHSSREVYGKDHPYRTIELTRSNSAGGSSSGINRARRNSSQSHSSSSNNNNNKSSTFRLFPTKTSSPKSSPPKPTNRKMATAAPATTTTTTTTTSAATTTTGSTTFITTASKNNNNNNKHNAMISTRSSSGYATTASSAASTSSDVGIQSISGSIANMTIASNDTANTAKVSNKRKKEMQYPELIPNSLHEPYQQHHQTNQQQQQHHQQQSNKKSKTISWGKLKRFMGGKKEKSSSLLLVEEMAAIVRVQEGDDTGMTRAQKEQLDVAILGRLDGMDVLSLGPAHLRSYPTTQHNNNNNTINTMNPLQDSFQEKLTPERMVQDMLWISSGKVPAEMVLEGFLAKERWIVVMEAARPLVLSSCTTGSHSPIPSLASLTDDDCSVSCIEDGSLPIHLLLQSMWGAAKPPTTATTRQGTEDEQDIMQLAAACSVPIDCDEDTFIIDTPQHLESVHDIASVPLKRGDYDSALEIFSKILRGLQSDNGDKPHLLGSCWHNIGTIQCWQGKYSEAKESFAQAVAIRDQDLPPNHPDVAVSLMRYSLALFALGQLSESISALNRALIMHPKESMTRAKILNNLGVVHYQSQDLVSALKHFTAALEIQREWLDGPVRRESIVYDATVTLGNMGKCYLQRQDYVTACFVYEEALLLQMTAFRKDHDIVLVSLSNLAHAKAKGGEIKKSIQIYRGILKSQDGKYGENSKAAAETMSIMGQMYLSQYNHEEALKCFTSVRDWQKLNLDPNHPAAVYVSETVKMMEEKIQGEVSVWI